MAAFHLGRTELPEAFPIFPLPGALLLPRSKLPLNIFEPRYLAMVEDALGAGRMIAMIQPDASAPVTTKGPGLFRVGCLGRLTSFSETEDGRYQITLAGVTRFRVAEELESIRGYRRVRGDYAPFVRDLDPSAQPAGGRWAITASATGAPSAASRPVYISRRVRSSTDIVNLHRLCLLRGSGGKARIFADG